MIREVPEPSSVAPVFDHRSGPRRLEATVSLVPREASANAPRKQVVLVLGRNAHDLDWHIIEERGL